MECNCNNNNNRAVIPWVRGNRLPLVICVYEDVVTQEGEGSLVHNKMERVPYEIQAADTVTVVMKSGFRQVEMPFTTEGNKVLVTDNGELAAGTYTVEVTIVRGDGARGRWQETRQVRVYENTSDAQLGEMYAIEADLFFWAKGDTGNGIADITSNPDDTLTITMTDGTTYTTQAMKGDKGDKGDQGEKGTSIVSFDVTGQTDTSVIYTVTFSDDTTEEVAVPKGPQGDTGLTGNGIASATLNSDYTLTIAYTDGTTYTTPSIRGAQGVQGVSIIAFTQTGETATNTLYNVVFSDGRTQSVAIPKGVKGDKGDTGNPGSQGAQGPKGDTVTATDYTLYNVQGGSSEGAMSQDATTKAISAQTGYYTCGTAAGTPEKVVTVESGNLYKRTLGGHFKVKMTNKNTAASGVTLQVGSETAAALWYNGAAVSATNTWDAGEVISVYFDGTNYQASNAQGGGGKFASGEKVKETSITDEVTENSTALLESGGLFKILYAGQNTEVLGSELTSCGAIIRSSDNIWLSSRSTNNNAALIDVRQYVGKECSCSIIKGTNNGISYAFLTAGPVLNTRAQFASGYTAVVHSDNDVTLAIPSDAVYLFVYLNSSNTYYTPNKVTFSIDSLYQRIVNCENLEFATGEKVKDTSISNEVKNNSDLVTGSSVFPIMAKINAAEGNLDEDIDTIYSSGSTYNATGEPVADNYTIRTDYIDVSNISTLYADIPNLPNGYNYQVKPTFYNSNKALVETPQWTSKGTGEMAIGIPSGTTYVIVVFNAFNGSTRITLTPQNSYGSHIYVKIQSGWSNLLEKVNQVEGIENKINEAEGIPVPVADMYWEQGSTMNIDGTNGADNNCIRSSYIDTSALTKLYFSVGNMPEGYVLRLKPTWYNSSKGLLETPVWSGDLLSKEIDVPTGAYYLRLVVAMYSVGGTQTTLTPALADTYSIRLSDSVSEWFGLLDKVNRLANNEVARKMAPTTMKVASYNIGHFSHGGKDSNITSAQYNDKLAAYKNLIYNQLNADIIGLCEYSAIFGKNTDNVDVYAKDVLFTRYGFQFANFIQLNYSCNAMYSRYYIENVTRRIYECNRNAVITHTTAFKASDCYYIESDMWMSGRKVKLIMTHLAFDLNNPQIVANQISELITKFASEPKVIMMGDWNVASFSQFDPFVAAGYTLGNKGQATYSDTNPTKALDNIIVKGVEISNVGVVQTSGLSDHLPLYATITLP